ncbi:hypothetical protein [Hydrogenophaga sp. BPS33]|uniref:hypothetical protein n=1 Tax=Hydrogenophaga sp. BPS33 TaxID=2651974 RepID=UPI0013200CFF|nr:hypothetical protein [Hydrogenophaga sp. BPS33]QHE86575.1 hypothetical protein F9K07_17570 [Hydrogenophaga sp. BPS33]
MNKDTSKMTSDELRAMAAALIKQAEAQSTREFESTMNFLSDKLKRMGKTKKDAVLYLIKMMRTHEAEATLAELSAGTPSATKGRKNKERADLDSEGNPPEVGVTYRLPTGESWQRKGKVGATKREFAEHAQTTTWAAMRA